MEKIIVASPKAPAAAGPFSQATIYNGVLYASGTMPLVPETGLVAEGGVTGQAKQALDNLANVLEAGGSSFDKVLKTTVFLKDMNDFALINDIYKSYFKDNYPARSCVEVARLPKDILFEIECIAICE